MTIQNLGNNSASNFNVSYQINDGDVISETYSATLVQALLYSTLLIKQLICPMQEIIKLCYHYLFSDEVDTNNSVTKNITNVASGDCPDEYSLPTVWRDNFECYDAFTIDNFGDWVSYDLDGGTTWGANAIDFTNESYVGSGIIFNYPLVAAGSGTVEWDTYEGNQGLYFFASGANSTTFPNDDWMISPEFTIDGVTSPTLSFWANPYGSIRT